MIRHYWQGKQNWTNRVFVCSQLIKCSLLWICQRGSAPLKWSHDTVHEAIMEENFFQISSEFLFFSLVYVSLYWVVTNDVKWNRSQSFYVTMSPTFEKLSNVNWWLVLLQIQSHKGAGTWSLHELIWTVIPLRVRPPRFVSTSQSRCVSPAGK